MPVMGTEPSGREGLQIRLDIAIRWHCPRFNFVLLEGRKMHTVRRGGLWDGHGIGTMGPTSQLGTQSLFLKPESSKIVY
jgi:hypothetical protein